MLRTANSNTIRNTYYIIGAVLTGDDVEQFGIDNPLKDDDINPSFIERLINTIADMSNNDFNKALKLLNIHGVI